MKQRLIFFVCVAFTLLVGTATAQVNWNLGMRFGLSIGAGGESPKVYNFFTGQFEGGGTKAGLHFGPSGEVIFNKNLAVATAFNINTQSGTPIEWMNLFKYYFSIPGSKIKPYADGGFSLYFVTGGPYVSIPFGGGALFPLANKLYIPADLQFGPIFASGSTVFAILITTGIRYEL